MGAAAEARRGPVAALVDFLVEPAGNGGSVLDRRAWSPAARPSGRSGRRRRRWRTPASTIQLRRLPIRQDSAADPDRHS